MATGAGAHYERKRWYKIAEVYARNPASKVNVRRAVVPATKLNHEGDDDREHRDNCAAERRGP